MIFLKIYHVGQKKISKLSHACVPLKVPKREIFITELYILSYPNWVGDLRTEPKIPFVFSVRLIFAILFFNL
jgi:hypothetical protein